MRALMGRKQSMKALTYIRKYKFCFSDFTWPAKDSM
jgi:hypothetical protein